jgi:hypothetical protein
MNYCENESTPQGTRIFLVRLFSDTENDKDW